jgi:large subunit ribosomal protein L9
MKIVLRQDVPKLGDAGTVQNVADGYARNYLIPQGLAVMATPGEMRAVAERTKVQDRKTAREEQRLQSLADRIQGQRITFNARSGEHGRLFGSVTASDIAERLSKITGQDVDRRRVVLEEPIRSTGEHHVTVHLVGRLRPEVTVIVEGPDQPVADSQPEASASADSNGTETSDQAQNEPAAEESAAAVEE